MLHVQLRQAREAKGLSLAALEDRIGVKIRVLAAIDRGAFGELPAGLYGRHAIRAYAAAVGLNADRVLEEVGGLLRPLEDPLDGLARVRGLGRKWPRIGSRDEPPLPDERRKEVTDALRTGPDWRPLAAAAVDGGLIAAIVGLVVKLTALAAGASVSEVARVALPAWAVLALVIAIAYFVLLGGIRNATFGAEVTGARVVRGQACMVDARTAVRRGMRCALRESSVIVEWLHASFGTGSRLREVNQRS